MTTEKLSQIDTTLIMPALFSKHQLESNHLQIQSIEYISMAVEKSI